MRSDRYLEGGYPVCGVCGAVGWGNASCANCVLHWPSSDLQRKLHALVRTQAPGQPVGMTPELEIRLNMLRFDAMEALERLVGRDWQSKLRLARAEEEWRIEWEMREPGAWGEPCSRWTALRAVLRDWCKGETNYRLSRLERVLYGLKALICVALNWTYRPTPARGLRVHFINADTGAEDSVVAWRGGERRRQWAIDRLLERLGHRVHEDTIPLDCGWKPMSAEKALKRAEDRLRARHNGWRDLDFIEAGTIRSEQMYGGWHAEWVAIPYGWRCWGWKFESDGDSSL